MDLASIIVERSTILPAILPGAQCKASPDCAAATLRALLMLFASYVRSAAETLAPADDQPGMNAENRNEWTTVELQAGKMPVRERTNSREIHVV